MALREFIDETGREWRVWDITRDRLDPRVRDAQHVRALGGSWLVFEAVDGCARHRLSPIPHGWADVADETLRSLLDAVRSDLSSRRADSAMQGPEQVRTFRYPGGRYWTVSECTVPDRRYGSTGSARRVLRFTAGSRALDRANWPADWPSYSDDQLVELLASGFPRAATGEVRAVERRRAFG